MPPPNGPHPPGSFTKNFAWHGTGLLTLHSAIRTGFSASLQPVTRTVFRASCGLSADEFYIAANFFLFNIINFGTNEVPIDEFVRQAIDEPHSLAFDRLALFVLNLSFVGARTSSTNGREYPVQWANEFVKQTLWQDGRWQRAALDEPAMDADIFPRIKGVNDAKRKSRSNYRHLFELTRYLPSPLGSINSDAESWAASALFTAWDRRALAAGANATLQQPSTLIAGSVAEQDYKLLGIGLEEFQQLAEPIAAIYVSAGGMSRFGSQAAELSNAGLFSGKGTGVAVAGGGSTTAVGTGSTMARNVTQMGRGISSALGGNAAATTGNAGATAGGTGAGAGGAKLDLSWLTASATEAAVERQIAQRLSQKRNQLLAQQLKEYYGHRCMACNSMLVVAIGPERYYAEAAHIKPLGAPYNGPDTAQNMIVLCPNHHLQFDRGVLSVEEADADYRFVSHIPGDPAHHKPLVLKINHSLDPKCLQWHRAFFASVLE